MNVRRVVGLYAGCLLAVTGCGVPDSSTDETLAVDQTSAAEAELKNVTAYTMIRHWNTMAMDATGLDHTPVTPPDARVFGEQLGPTRASRSTAIVQLAVFEAMNATSTKYNSLVGMPHAKNASTTAAVAAAAHDALVAMYPSQAPTFDTQFSKDMAALSSTEKEAGVAAGHKAAQLVLASRINDGSVAKEPKVGTDVPLVTGPGQWQPDPLTGNKVALGYYWRYVTPFVIASADQFRPPPPPALDSQEYAAAFNEVKQLGGDVTHTATTRTPEQTEIGVFWAYDGRPSLCAPPRLYNQIAMVIADKMGTSKDAVKLARLLALINLAMADTGIAIWDAKYEYNLWRPISGIRGAAGGTGSLVSDANWYPYGAPASNAQGPNFTPPFPSYPSGHAGFGGALFQMLRNFYGTDDIAFDFVSDEYNGQTKDGSGNPRPVVKRSYAKLSQAEEENGQSRIYLGIHWVFDKTSAITVGQKVADEVFARALTPL